MNKSTAPAAKGRLLESGAVLMAEKGYSGVSVRQICKHAGTSMNMIHHYFGSKEGLLEAIVEQFSAKVFAVPSRLLEPAPRSKPDFRSRMEMLFEATLDAYIDQRAILMVVIREQANPSALAEFMERFVAFLEQAKGKGLVRQEVDSEMITGIMHDRILNQVQFAPWIKKTFGQDLMGDAKYKKRWCDSNLDLFLHGFVR